MTFPQQYFRAGVGAVIVNQQNLVLALERADVLGAWQFPQGGLEMGEEPCDAVLREVEEETSIPSNYLDLIKTVPDLLAYELPFSAQNKKMGRGQVQYWFIFRFKGPDEVIDVSKGGEFYSWKWIPFKDVVKNVVSFRKNVYCRLFEFYQRMI